MTIWFLSISLKYNIKATRLTIFGNDFKSYLLSLFSYEPFKSSKTSSRFSIRLVSDSTSQKASCSGCQSQTQNSNNGHSRRSIAIDRQLLYCAVNETEPTTWLDCSVISFKASLIWNIAETLWWNKALPIGRWLSSPANAVHLQRTNFGLFIPKNCEKQINLFVSLNINKFYLPQRT